MSTKWLLIGLIPYLLLLLYWVKGILSLGRKNVKQLPTYNQGCSIVIAFRNEADQLGKLLDSLKAQTIEHNRVEFIFINDHSEDDGPIQVQRVCREDKRFRMETLNSEEGKKAAIRKGVELAQFDYVITTDADCQHHEDWVKSMLDIFESQKLDLLAAPVSFMEKNVWSRIFNIEQASLMAATAGSIGNKSAFICNGANLMFKRSDYLSLTKAELKTNLLSGDDVFLLHALKKRKGIAAQIGFLTNNKVTALTSFPPSLRDFIAQRLRWLQKGKAYDDRDAWLQSSVILTANITVLLAFSLFFFGQINFFQVLLVFFVKYLADLILICTIRAWFKIKALVTYSLFLAILYPFYSLIIAFLSLFYRPKWKGRRA